MADTKIGVKPPKKDYYNFTKGQQVALYSDRKGLRWSYEFIEQRGCMYLVKNVSTGTEHRVWKNKVQPLSEANKVMRKLEEYNEAEDHKPIAKELRKMTHNA